MVILVDKVSKIYKSGVEPTLALANVSFKVPKSCIFCIMGPSGSGKTTLLNIISGLMRPDTGKVVVLGANFSEMSDKEVFNFRLRNIGYIFQDFKLIDIFTARENILLPLVKLGVDWDEGEKRLEKIAKLLGIEDLLDKYPHELSYGEMQRVAIARELVKDCRIILADEPTSNIDIERKKRVLGYFKELISKGEKTIVIASHDRLVLDYCDYVGELVDGTLISVLNKEEFMKTYKSQSIENDWIIEVRKLRLKLLRHEITEDEFVEEYLKLKEKFYK